MFQLLKISFITILIPVLSGCGSSSDSDDTTKYSYLRFYNASINAGAVELIVTDSSDSDITASIGVVDFADISSVIAIEVESYDLDFLRYLTDEDDEQVSVLTSSISSTESMASVQILLGDIVNPELIEFSYDTDSIDDLDDDEFELYVTNLSTEYSFVDVYISEEGEELSDADLIGTLDYKEFSSLQVFEQENYIVYLTETGTQTVLFESPAISFTYLQTYILSIRDDSGIKGVAMDRLSSSSIVYSYNDEDTESHVRFYQSTNSSGDVDIFVDDVDGTPTIDDLSPGILSEIIPLDSDVYTISSTASDDNDLINVKNLVLNLEQDESKTVFLYTDSDNNHQGLIFDQHNRNMAYENQVRIVNLGEDDQDINVYFIKNDETLSTTENELSLIKYAETKSLTLATQQYQIMITTEDSNDNVYSLYESEPITFTSNTNYLMVLEKDDLLFSGYDLIILEE